MKVYVKKIDGNLYFRLDGELDENSSHNARELIDDVLEKSTYNNVVFDMKDLTFMDSTGIGVIIGRYKKLKPTGVGIYVLNPTRQVDKILTTSGLYQILKKIG